MMKLLHLKFLKSYKEIFLHKSLYPHLQTTHPLQANDQTEPQSTQTNPQHHWEVDPEQLKSELGSSITGSWALPKLQGGKPSESRVIYQNLPQPLSIKDSKMFQIPLPQRMKKLGILMVRLQRRWNARRSNQRYHAKPSQANPRVFSTAWPSSNNNLWSEESTGINLTSTNKIFQLLTRNRILKP